MKNSKFNRLKLLLIMFLFSLASCGGNNKDITGLNASMKSFSTKRFNKTFNIFMEDHIYNYENPQIDGNINPKTNLTNQTDVGESNIQNTPIVIEPVEDYEPPKVDKVEALVVVVAPISQSAPNDAEKFKDNPNEILVDIIQGEKIDQLRDKFTNQAKDYFVDYVLNDPIIGEHHVGKPILVYAIEAKKLQIAEELLNWGANPDLTEESTGNTALMYASDNEDLAAIKLLLQFNTDITIANFEGQTALDFTTNNLVGTLIKTGKISQEALNEALEVAIKEDNDLVTMRFALENGADPNYKIRRMPALFYVIASAGQKREFVADMVELLIEFNADVNYTHKNMDIYSFLDRYFFGIGLDAKRVKDIYNLVDSTFDSQAANKSEE